MSNACACIASKVLNFHTIVKQTCHFHAPIFGFFELKKMTLKDYLLWSKKTENKAGKGDYPEPKERSKLKCILQA